MSEHPSPWWSRGWRLWVAIGIAYEVISAIWGKPLTGVARKRALHRAGGSAFVGGFLVWLIAHWLWVPSGFGWIDAGAVVFGALMGWAGYRWRHRTDHPDRRAEP